MGDDITADISTWDQVACTPVVEQVDSDIITDCTGTTSTEQVDKVVSLKGAENVIPVRIIEDCEPEVTIDYEYVCNDTTGVYDLHVFTTTDGAPNTTPTIVATTLACSTPADQYQEELYCNGTTGTTWIRTVSFDSDGTKTVVSEVDSLVACNSSSDEIDQYETDKVEYCLNGTDQVLVYDIVQFNNRTQAEASRVTHYIV